MAPKQTLLPSGYIPFPEAFASGHILCHRRIGQETLIKLIAYRDQINTEYERMPEGAEGPEGSGDIDSKFFGSPKFLARFKLTSIVMSLQTAAELRDALDEMIKKAEAGEYIGEE